MGKIIKYGIKFPITIDSPDKTLFDMNNTLADSVSSKIQHVIFTPKGQKLRDPNFGTNLIKYIFDPNESETWNGVKEEIRNAIKTYVPECSFKDIIITTSEDGRELYAKFKYSISNGIVDSIYETTVKL